jgi:hypothetical protein
MSKVVKMVGKIGINVTADRKALEDDFDVEIKNRDHKVLPYDLHLKARVHRAFFPAEAIEFILLQKGVVFVSYKYRSSNGMKSKIVLGIASKTNYKGYLYHDGSITKNDLKPYNVTYWKPSRFDYRIYENNRRYFPIMFPAIAANSLRKLPGLKYMRYGEISRPNSGIISKKMPIPKDKTSDWVKDLLEMAKNLKLETLTNSGANNPQANQPSTKIGPASKKEPNVATEQEFEPQFEEEKRGNTGGNNSDRINTQPEKKSNTASMAKWGVGLLLSAWLGDKLFNKNKKKRK